MNRLSPELFEQEKDRFNALSPEAATRIAEEVDGALPIVRSCWYCNRAHEHLKEVDYLTCFGCGLRYVRGFPAQILGMRMRGEPVTRETMILFRRALDSGI